jgi:hypothetical protein
MENAPLTSEKNTKSAQAREAFRKKMVNPFTFRLFNWTKLPMLAIAGIKLKEIDGRKAVVTAPYRWLTQNPFQSMYFAVQAMAAELSTGALALYAVTGRKPSVAVIITHMEARFLKKANGLTAFVCEEGDKLMEVVNRCEATGEPATLTVKSEGRMADGTLVSVFEFTWSFRQRSKPAE